MSNQEQTIQRYLLGELPESEQVLLEQQYFTDQQLFEQMVQVENELVDKYAHGLLTPMIRERFEKHYLTDPQRRERARFAEAMAEKIGQNKMIDSREPWLSRLLYSLRGPQLAWGLSTAVLLITVVAAWFFIESRRLRQDLARSESERVSSERRELELQQQVTDEHLRSEDLAAELERLRSNQETEGSPATVEVKKPSRFATLVLTIGGTRSLDTGPPALLSIRDGTEQVRLQLNLRESDYSSYRVLLQSAGGEEIYSWNRLRPRGTRTGASLTLLLPARRLVAGDYILTLRGVSDSDEVEDVSKSLFRVERE
jgi:hypothetical protein